MLHAGGVQRPGKFRLRVGRVEFPGLVHVEHAAALGPAQLVVSRDSSFEVCLQGVVEILFYGLLLRVQVGVGFERPEPHRVIGHGRAFVAVDFAAGAQPAVEHLEQVVRGLELGEPHRAQILEQRIEVRGIFAEKIERTFHADGVAGFLRFSEVFQLAGVLLDLAACCRRQTAGLAHGVEDVDAAGARGLLGLGLHVGQEFLLKGKAFGVSQAVGTA